MSITAGRDARLGTVPATSSCAAAAAPSPLPAGRPDHGVGAGTRRSYMTSSPPRSHAQHMAFLAGTAALNAVHSLTEISRASGNLVAGTAARAADPVGLVT